MPKANLKITRRLSPRIEASHGLAALRGERERGNFVDNGRWNAGTGSQVLPGERETPALSGKVQ